MTLSITGIVLFLSVLIVAVAAWQDRKPYQPGQLWRVPWRAVMALGILAVLILGAHGISLMTGHPITGRTGLIGQ